MTSTMPPLPQINLSTVSQPRDKLGEQAFLALIREIEAFPERNPPADPCRAGTENTLDHLGFALADHSHASLTLRVTL
jgi:DNA-binding LacI/PurR family transcriptional regulator